MIFHVIFSKGKGGTSRRPSTRQTEVVRVETSNLVEIKKLGQKAMREKGFKGFRFQSYREVKDETTNKPLVGLERYPEFKPLVNKIVRSTIREINAEAVKVPSEMQYKTQFVLEEVIQKLQELV